MRRESNKMAEATTFRLNANGPLSGSGLIPLDRTGFASSANGRLLTASIPQGSRVGADVFGFFGPGGIKAVTVSATTHNPRDVLRVYLGTSARTEVRLSAGPQTITLGPGEELAFVTEAALVLQLVVNDLADGEQASRIEESAEAVIRAQVTSNVGFNATGVMGVTLTWSEGARILQAGNVGAGALPLEAIDPRESRYSGYYWRVRVSGCDGPTFAGVGNRLTGDAALSELAPGQWSSPVRVSHDDLLAVQSPTVRAGCPTVIAEHELVPLGDTITVTATGAPTTGGTVQPGGVIPWASFTNLSVNAAGAVRSEEGWEMWTHAITGNPNAAGNKGFHGGGAGNKSILGTDFIDDMALGAFTSFSVRYGLRTAGNDHALNRPYVNVLIDVNGDGSLYKIGVLDAHSNPQLNLLTDVTEGVATEHEYTRAWVGAGKIKIVNELAGVVPAVNLGAGWLNKVFTISDILAVYPDARLVRAFPADGGLPADLTLPALWLVVGDSTYTRYSRIIVREVRVNG